jgi:hypothetical protein
MQPFRVTPSLVEIDPNRDASEMADSTLVSADIERDLDRANHHHKQDRQDECRLGSRRS